MLQGCTGNRAVFRDHTLVSFSPPLRGPTPSDAKQNAGLTGR